MDSGFSWRAFWLPATILALLLLGIAGVPFTLMLATVAGVARILVESWQELRQRRYSLDYIALVAMVVALASGQFLAGAVVAFMFTGGKALEAFAEQKAHATLKALGDTIPKNAQVWRGNTFVSAPLQGIRDGEKILVKRGELVPLDGTLLSLVGGIFNLSNLTGEMEPASFRTGTFLKSGAVNVGDTVEIQVVGDFSSSTYHKIVQLVEEAKAHPARLVRLSERANIYFTIITFVFVVVAYLFDHSLMRMLAVLVIATPCPLIIAAPVAFIGGMSRAARSGIIVRKPAALENIDAAKVVFFDKTGTLTLGEPVLLNIVVAEAAAISSDEALRIAAAIEIHSLHPLARVIVGEAEKRGVVFPIATEVTEKIGQGINAKVDDARYAIVGCAHSHRGMTLELRAGERVMAHFYFADELKEGVEAFLKSFTKRGVHVEILTGDTRDNAESVFKGIPVTIHAGALPQDKYSAVEAAHAAGKTVVMIGDGLNDAPALARADAGVVFSGTENGASIEAADVVMLDHHIEKAAELFSIAHRTLTIARQSIYGGIILSCIGMAFAAVGVIPPVTGALIQEVIDVVVIINALRTLKIR